ncbi:hypothetical protein EVAR_95126_1 [Eumeta japonica]|uniref:Reverse transcriptase domain-containing protein n=1 Tax=Eumeta variegata TaxID=151549 RepID=A0A4C1W4G8_EUMVA|nr:hypothetical protein EVAR_95126_1 [Eumeta japonica]
MPTHNCTITATYADDTAILLTHETHDSLSESLQQHLALIEVWLKQWRNKGSTDKSVEVTFTLRRKTCPLITPDTTDTTDCNQMIVTPSPTSVFDPSSVLFFGPGPACDSAPIRFYSRPVRNSLSHPTFNTDFATSHNSDLDEAGTKNLIEISDGDRIGPPELLHTAEAATSRAYTARVSCLISRADPFSCCSPVIIAWPYND